MVIFKKKPAPLKNTAWSSSVFGDSEGMQSEVCRYIIFNNATPSEFHSAKNRASMTSDKALQTEGYCFNNS